MTVTTHDLRTWKTQGRRFAMLTAYDHPTARILDDAGIPVILVGDSVGNAVLGYDTTLPVTMEEMLHHTAAVSRGAKNALVVARPAVRVLPGVGRGRRSQRDPVPQGGRRRSGEARRSAARGHRGADARRHPRHGPHRPHAAIGPRDGRLPGAGSDGGGRAQAAGRRPGPARRPARSRSSSKEFPSTSAPPSPKDSRSRRSASERDPARTAKCS